MRFGIDIRGGVEAVFEPSGLKTKPTEEQLEMAREVIETRLDAQNILDREVTVDEKAGDVIVRFPWKSDEKDFNPEEAIQELGRNGRIDLPRFGQYRVYKRLRYFQKPGRFR